MTLKSDFKNWQDIHPNPFTPKIVNLERSDNNIIELSKERDREFYGVAVWERTEDSCETCNEGRPEHTRFKSLNHDLSQSFHDREEAQEYQQLLKDKIKSYEEIKELVEEVNE